ncbi:MAG: cobalamin biosynthesis protein [Nitrosopumilus sp.]|jgi:cobalt-precorrin 5A hydrolase
MENVSVLAITKNGVNIGGKLKELFPDWNIFAPSKLSNENKSIIWYSEPTSDKIIELFKNSNALICLFSLGAVIRLIAPHLKDKKTDPAVIVIDDKMTFVISVLSGHIGGANELTQEISEKLNALPVITTAADVNKTIVVDLVGRQFGWKIDDETTVTKISAHMVNSEPIGVFQQTGNTKWYKELPKNVTIYDNLEELKKSNSKAHLIISDAIIDNELAQESVIYRPQSLVIGIGLHWDTTKDTIREGIEYCLEKFNLSSKCIAKLVSIKKPEDVQGLIDLGKEMKIPVEYVDREELSEIITPNPSSTVKAFEGTASVSEAAAIKVSCGELIVEKQKFPPNLTIAIARKVE